VATCSVKIRILTAIILIFKNSFSTCYRLTQYSTRVTVLQYYSLITVTVIKHYRNTVYTAYVLV